MYGSAVFTIVTSSSSMNVAMHTASRVHHLRSMASEITRRARPASRSRIRSMLVLALSEAEKTTITFIAIWFVVFPAIVTGLIAFAVVQSLAEARENREHWKFRRR